MKFKLIFVFIVIFPFLLCGQETFYKKLSPFTQSLLNASKVYKDRTIDKKEFYKSFAIDQSGEKMYVSAFVEFTETVNPEELKHLDVHINSIFGNIVTVRMPVETITQLASMPEVKRIQIGTPVESLMDKARSATNVDKVQAGIDLPQIFRGKDVVIGIIDGGFEFGHIDFYDAENKKLRIKRVWNQNDAKGVPPEGFSYGTEYKTESEILSPRFDNRGNTHGTHVAGIAAGSDTTCMYYGAAPQSDIVLVSYDAKWASNAIVTDGIKYIFDYAASVGKPCVVNLSLGSYFGAHDGKSTFDVICDELQGPGRLLVGASGNEGNKNMHVSKNVSQTDTLKTFLSGTNYGSHKVDIWGEKDKTYKVSLVTYSSKSKKEIYESEAIEVSGSGPKEIILKSPETGVGVIINAWMEKNPNNDKLNVYLGFDIYGLHDNYLGLKVWGDNGTIHIWGNLPNSFSSYSVSGWTNPNNDYSIGEIGGTGKRIISVGSYASKNEYINIKGENIKKEIEIGSLSAFSSKGPTADGRMKPDITAPGEIIVSSYSSAVATIQSQKSSVVFENPVGLTKYYYGEMSGTSMATPHVAGILATWLEANPYLTPEDVRQVLKQTSIKDLYTSGEPGNSWGYGKIDAWNGLKEVIRLYETNIDLQNTLTMKDKIYSGSKKGIFNLAFVTDDSRVKVSVYSMNGLNVYNSFLGNVSALTEYPINVPYLEKGVYVVWVKGDNRVAKYRLVLK